MSLDFTLDKYVELCDTVQGLPLGTMTLARFVKAGQPERPVIVFRHDVDRSLDSALRMAQLEAGLGIRSTYYVRMTRPVFSPEAMLHLHELGHEVGYHYEVLARARGNDRGAIAMFERELARLREVVPVETISMHGSPLSPWNNLDLWHTHDFGQYGLSEASLSIDYERIYYFTDTGRSWDPNRCNLRDHVDARKPPVTVSSTDDLIAFLRRIPDGPVVINTHPNRWAENRYVWVVSAILDWMVNRAKQLVAWHSVYRATSKGTPRWRYES